MYTANENPVPSASVSFHLIYRSFAWTLLVSPNRRHLFVTPDYLRGLKPWGAGGALFVLDIFNKNDIGKRESPSQDISVCFSTTEAYSVRRRTNPDWSIELK
jgi:hypothetical protein